MKVTVPVEVSVPTPTINIVLPADAPLMCDVKTASKLFGLSERELTDLRKRNKDFPARKIGRTVRFLVPDLYAWFREQ